MVAHGGRKREEIMLPLFSAFNYESPTFGSDFVVSCGKVDLLRVLRGGEGFKIYGNNATSSFSPRKTIRICQLMPNLGNCSCKQVAVYYSSLPLQLRCGKEDA